MPNVKPVSAEQVKDLIARGKVLILDVRSQDEVERTGKVPSARQISAIDVRKRARPDSPTFDPTFQKAETIVVYCAMGARSCAVAEILVKQGYPDVRDLGKFSYWSEAGLEVDYF